MCRPHSAPHRFCYVVPFLSPGFQKHAWKQRESRLLLFEQHLDSDADADKDSQLSCQHWLVSLKYVHLFLLQRVYHTTNSCYSLESFCLFDLQLLSLCLPPSLVPCLRLTHRSLDPSSSADMTAGDVTSWLSAFSIYRCLCLVTASHCEELDMTGLDVILTLHDPLPPSSPTLSRSLFCMHSYPLSQTLSSDLLRCRYDRCRCQCLSPYLSHDLLTPCGVWHDRCGCHLQVNLTTALPL